jgi:high-affinity iron transporter
VYREVFETILFVNTLWLEADNSAKTQIITGAATAIGLLGLVAWGIFKFSMRLPLKLFFRINAVFLYVLAVVFAGKGIAALQEAGKLPIDSVPFIEIDALGIYPNVESLSVQAFLILLALIFYLGNQFKRDGNMEKTKKAH